MPVGSLKDLDALVGKAIVGETPHVHWEETQTHLRFETAQEAIEAIHDPFFQKLAPILEEAPVVVSEVEEFRCYSSDLTTAWMLVEQFNEPIHVKHEEQAWAASFGKKPMVVAPTPAIAICLAALRAKGIEVELVRDAPLAINVGYSKS